jgi:hypothetical protein
MNFAAKASTGASLNGITRLPRLEFLDRGTVATFSKLAKKLNDASLCKRRLASELARGPVQAPSRGLNALGCGHFFELSLSQVNFISVDHNGDQRDEGKTEE